MAATPEGCHGAWHDRQVTLTPSAPVALVTGASSGIGAAAAHALADAGFQVVAAARRLDRCEEVAAGTGGRALQLDVTDAASIAAAVAALDRLDLVVHCAGGAIGLAPALADDLDTWRAMYESNVIGVVALTQALAPQLRASSRGHVIVIGSIAGLEVYPGGGGYTAAKHAVHAVCQTLRLELHTEGVRVTEIAPGMVETEFSLVRFGGDAARAAKVYEGLTPLTAQDVAEIVAFAATRPPHVDIDHLVVKPVAQASATVAHRVTT